MYLTGGFGMIPSALALIVLMIAAATVFIRRTWLRAAAIERQLEEFRNQLWFQLQQRDEVEQRRALDSQADIRSVRRDLSLRIDDVLSQIQAATTALHDQVADVSSQNLDPGGHRRTHIAADPQQLCHRCQRLGNQDGRRIDCRGGIGRVSAPFGPISEVAFRCGLGESGPGLPGSPMAVAVFSRSKA